MATNQGTVLLLAGAGALLLMSRKKRRRSGGSVAESSPPDSSVVEDDLDDEEGDVFEPEEREDDEEIFEEISDPDSPEQILLRYIGRDDKAELGRIYQVKPGDTPLEICREALFGTRDLITDPAKRQAAKDLLVRIDCSPYNQALYAVPLDELREGHANIDSYFTQKGVSFNPIYQDNYQRILEGLAPTAKPGDHLPLIYIPMINLDIFDTTGVVTTEGMYYPDDEHGMGYSMIMPPREILNLQFEQVTGPEVGCELPEGDYRQQIVANA